MCAKYGKVFTYTPVYSMALAALVFVSMIIQIFAYACIKFYPNWVENIMCTPQ